MIYLSRIPREDWGEYQRMKLLNDYPKAISPMTNNDIAEHRSWGAFGSLIYNVFPHCSQMEVTPNGVSGFTHIFL